MRKMLPLLVVGILVLGGLGAVSGTESEKKEITSEKIVFSQPIVDVKGEFVTIAIDETNSFIMEQGKPMLPCYTQKFTFPFGTQIEGVTCTPSSFVTQTVSKDVEPTPLAAIVGTTISTSSIQRLNYGTELYPSAWFEYDVATGLYKGDLSTIVTVQVNPVKYHPVEKTIEMAKEVDIKIAYEPPNNPRQTRADHELLIICADEYSDELATFVTHKEGRGITTKLATLTEVYASVSGDDDQEEIKLYIKDSMETWGTTSVLLVGSNSKLPTRKVYCYFAAGDDDEIFISDLYYADIYYGTGEFAKWDSNGNGRHAEYRWLGNTDTDIDYHADIRFGRWACTSGAQVTTCVNKVKYYENNPAYLEDWFFDLVVVGGDSFIDEENDPDYVREGEFVNEHVIDMMTGFVPNKQWVSNGKLTQPLMGVTNLNNAINAGCGFVDFSGHGNPITWATHPWKDGSKWVPTPTKGYYNTNAQSLDNGNELAIITIEACSTAKFNDNSNCLNWAFIQNSGGGAIGSFGATALGWGYIGEYVIQGLIGKIGLDTFRGYKLDDAITLGEMWVNALERMIETSMDGAERKTVLEWQCFGDPTLQIAEPSAEPNKPSTPDGPSSNLQTGVTYTYTTSATDPDGDDVEYMFYWGDDTSSGWVGPYNSGQTGSASKKWSETGTYLITAVAKDEHGKVSVWSDELSVSVTKARSKDLTFNALIQKFFDNHPYIFPILRQLLGF
ncbi:MAG: hypothetical protein KAW45_01435 [Thermoplasmatales archaeon]|nr:hypothetical protein [Thermoplasmatales archaeon]